jgi:predicted phage tail protein
MASYSYLMPLTTIRLHGELADRYTSELQADIDCVADAVSALQANYPTFKRSLIELHEAGMVFRVVVRHPSGEEWELDETQLGAPIGRGSVEIVPVPAGSSATARIIAGVVLVALGATGVGLPFATAGATVLLGASLAIGGVVSLLSVPSSNNTGTDDDNKPSLILNGTTNTSGNAGKVVNVVYGRDVWCGSHFVSGAVRAQTIIFDDDDDSVSD